jgi:transcriptional regulator GlxA family with amidase domain
MNARKTPIDLLFVIAPHSLLLDIAGPAEAFRLANLQLSYRKQPARFRLRFAGPEETAICSVGLPLLLEPLPKSLSAASWVVVVGQPSVHAGQLSPAIHALAQWLRRALRAPLETPGSRQRLLTVCSGSLIAARAGLLDQRQCTSHHDMLGLLRSLAPRAQVLDNRVFVIDGPVASSAGVTAGIDLALHLIAEECGEALAAAVAEDLVVYLRRSHRDPEISPFLAHRRHVHAAVHRVQEAVSTEPERDWTMPGMARLGHVTQRHLLRLFMRHAGVSPLQYLRSVRLERAKQLIERGTAIGTAAEEAGFRSPLHMRRAWLKQWGGSPRDVRPAAAAASSASG